LGNSRKLAVCRYGWIIDWLILPLVISAASIIPLLAMAEAGQYLGSVNAIFEGMVPYRDIFVLYGPLSVYVPAAIMKLAPATLETLRAYFHLCSIATVIVSYLLAVWLLQGSSFRLLACLCLVLETYNVEWNWFAGSVGSVCLRRS
jgi:hypothetical protein